MVEIRRADESDAKAVAETLHLAFADDPFSSWVFPERDDRERLHPGMMRHFVDLALATGEVYAVDDYTAVAVWFAVPSEDDDPDFVERTAAHCEGYGPRFRALAGTLHQHHPVHEPHHYLNFLATVPGRQSQGLGRLLLLDRLTRLDAIGIPAYLEASSPRSAALYERVGFVRTTPFALADGGPWAIPMWRPARSVGGSDPATLPAG